MSIVVPIHEGLKVLIVQANGVICWRLLAALWTYSVVALGEQELDNDPHGQGKDAEGRQTQEVDHIEVM